MEGKNENGMIEAYPLCWPVGYPRTKYPQNARFDTSFSSARDGIVRELRLLGGRSVIISTNIPLRRDGLPYANFQRPTDAGIAVYFTYSGEQVVFACDKWKSIEDNMTAVKKAIEAIRGLERWGVSDMLKRAFTGFKALPETGTKNNTAWWEILEVSQNASGEQIKSAYREQAKKHHPDNGGSSERFYVIQKAYEEASSIKQSA